MQAGKDAEVDVRALVREAQNGDADAFAGLYERFFDQMFRYVSFKTGNPDEAQDIVGEVFVRMLESIASFKWQGHPFSSWLFRIAHNLVVDHFRHKARNKTTPLENATAAATTSELDGYVDLKLTMHEVHRAMQGLTDLQREVISLRFAGGLSVAETARAVRKKENAVKALQHAGLKKLRRSLGPEPSVAVAMRHGEA